MAGAAPPSGAECAEWTQERCAEYFERDDVTNEHLCGGSECGTCFEGADWEKRLDLLGRGIAKRPAQQVHISARNWLSHQVVSALAQILLKEAMLYPVRLTPFIAEKDERPLNPIVCCGAAEPVVDYEVWDFTFNAGQFTTFIDSRPLGYEGTEQLYVPDSVSRRYPSALSWTTYTTSLPGPLALPRAALANCSHLLQPGATECKPENYVCNDNSWTVSNCTRGQWSPPWCRSADSTCSEVIMQSAQWSTGWFEAIVLNLSPRVNWTLSYYSPEAFKRRVAHRALRSLNTIFYWFEPDPFLVYIGGASSILFPRTDISCTSQAALEPTESAVNCAPPLDQLMKVSSPAAVEEGDLHNFTSRIKISTAQITAMLATHPEGGGNASSPWAVACGWLRRNPSVWAKWVSNTPPLKEQGPDIGRLLQIAVPILCLACLAGIAGAVWLMRRAHVREEKYDISDETILYLQGVGEVAMHILDLATDSLSLWEQVVADAPLWVPFCIVFSMSTIASVVAVLLSLRKLRDVHQGSFGAVDIARRAVHDSQAAVMLALLEDLPLLTLSTVSIVKHDVTSSFVLVGALLNGIGLGWKLNLALQYVQRHQRLRVLQAMEAYEEERKAQGELAADPDSGDGPGMTRHRPVFPGAMSLRDTLRETMTGSMPGDDGAPPKRKLSKSQVVASLLAAAVDAPFSQGYDTEAMLAEESFRRGHRPPAERQGAGRERGGGVARFILHPASPTPRQPPAAGGGGSSDGGWGGITFHSLGSEELAAPLLDAQQQVSEDTGGTTAESRRTPPRSPPRSRPSGSPPPRSAPQQDSPPAPRPPRTPPHPLPPRPLVHPLHQLPRSAPSPGLPPRGIDLPPPPEHQPPRQLSLPAGLVGPAPPPPAPPPVAPPAAAGSAPCRGGGLQLLGTREGPAQLVSRRNRLPRSAPPPSAPRSSPAGAPSPRFRT
eukprot:TRINITY_DN11026_c0_g1_i1.p1 TRINITY_DN11026_c0_g1~~TRINITY_DN11026_c0_g1_i1.p1  ORF type:complete len:974 (+),score=270.41 TRINITY_DN11026_c0_g1_i1:89-2923(+)